MTFVFSKMCAASRARRRASAPSPLREGARAMGLTETNPPAAQPAEEVEEVEEEEEAEVEVEDDW